MAGSALETVLRRERALVLATLLALTTLAWIYLLGANQAMLMPMSMPWGTAGFVLMLLMWVVMMVGMMTPSAAPMILLYVRVGQQAAARGRPLVATGWFTGGYLWAWTIFSLVATLVQLALSHSQLLNTAMAIDSGLLAGVLLIATGLYQYTPLKRACLHNCRAPLSFIQRHGGFQRRAVGSLLLGLRHGLYCVGCCWLLMALLLLVGVMNLAWVALLAGLVLAEKLVPPRWHLDRMLGLLLLATGATTLGLSVPV